MLLLGEVVSTLIYTGSFVVGSVRIADTTTKVSKKLYSNTKQKLASCNKISKKKSSASIDSLDTEESDCNTETINKLDDAESFTEWTDTLSDFINVRLVELNINTKLSMRFESGKNNVYSVKLITSDRKHIDDCAAIFLCDELMNRFDYNVNYEMLNGETVATVTITYKKK